MPEKQQDNLSKLQDAIDKLREGIGDLLVQKAAKSLAIVDASEKTYAEKKKEKESQLKIWDFFKAYEDALPDAEAVAARRNHLLCKDTPTWEEPKEGEDGELLSLPEDGPLQPLWPMEKDEKTKTWKRWEPKADKPFPPSLNVWFSYWQKQALANQGISLTRKKGQQKQAPTINFNALTCRNTNLLTAMLLVSGKKPKPFEGTMYEIVPNWVGLSEESTRLLKTALEVAHSAACRKIVWDKNEPNEKSPWMRRLEAFFDKNGGAVAPYISLMLEVAMLGRRLMQALLNEGCWARSPNWVKGTVRKVPLTPTKFTWEFTPTSDVLEGKEKLHAAELLLARFPSESFLNRLKCLAAFDEVSPGALRFKEKGKWYSPGEDVFAQKMKTSIDSYLPTDTRRGGYFAKTHLGLEVEGSILPLNDAQFGLWRRLPHVTQSAPSLLERAEHFKRRADPLKRRKDGDIGCNISNWAHIAGLLLGIRRPTYADLREGFVLPGLGYRVPTVGSLWEEPDGDSTHEDEVAGFLKENTKEGGDIAEVTYGTTQPWPIFVRERILERMEERLLEPAKKDERAIADAKERVTADIETFQSQLGSSPIPEKDSKFLDNLHLFFDILPELWLDFEKTYDLRLRHAFLRQPLSVSDKGKAERALQVLLPSVTRLVAENRNVYPVGQEEDVLYAMLRKCHDDRSNIPRFGSSLGNAETTKAITQLVNATKETEDWDNAPHFFDVVAQFRKKAQREAQREAKKKAEALFMQVENPLSLSVPPEKIDAAKSGWECIFKDVPHKMRPHDGTTCVDILLRYAHLMTKPENSQEALDNALCDFCEHLKPHLESIKELVRGLPASLVCPNGTPLETLLKEAYDKTKSDAEWAQHENGKVVVLFPTETRKEEAE